MIPHLTDDVVQHMQLTWSTTSEQFFVLAIPADESDPYQRVLRNFVMMSDWSDIWDVAHAVALQRGFAMDMRGFAYPQPSAPSVDELTNFEGVHVWDGSDTYIHLDTTSFETLMSRLFQTLLDGARQHHTALTQTPDWQAFEADAHIVSQRSPA